MEYLIKKVAINGFSMEYLRFGSGEKILVILPGLSVQSVMPSAQFIVKQYKIFAGEYTVCVFDRRLEAPEGYSISDMAEDTMAVLKHEGFERFYVFGASQGGMIAMIMAARYPDSVRKMVLASTAVHVDESRFALIKKWISFAREKDREGLMLSIGKSIYPEEYFEKYRKAFSALAQTVTDSEMERFMILAGSINGFDIGSMVRSITCPVLMAADETDKIFDIKAQEEMMELLKGNCPLKIKKYNGYGHAVYDTALDFCDVMYDFLETAGKIS